MRDYSQPGDPYGITHEYTAQSADQELKRSSPTIPAGVDVRGNAVLPARNVPTQAECDAIKAEL